RFDVTIVVSAVYGNKCWPVAEFVSEPHLSNVGPQRQRNLLTLRPVAPSSPRLLKRISRPSNAGGMRGDCAGNVWGMQPDCPKTPSIARRMRAFRILEILTLQPDAVRRLIGGRFRFQITLRLRDT